MQPKYSYRRRLPHVLKDLRPVSGSEIQTHTGLPAAFFGMDFDQFLGENYQAEDLRPLGKYVADNFSPFGFWI